jgi:hypothetical protein
LTLDEQSELGLGSDQDDGGCVEHFRPTERQQ